MENPKLGTNREFEEAYERYVGMVYRTCAFFLKNKADTEDAVQTVFLRLFAGGPAFREEEHRKAWLLKTASNYCRDVLRGKRSFPEDPELLARRMERESAGNGGEEAGFQGDETLELLLKLPPAYKAPLYLRYYEGYSCEETARILGKKASTVRSLLLRGRRSLRRLLEGESV